MFLNRIVCLAPCPGTSDFCGATRQIWRKWNETYEEQQIWTRNKLWQGQDSIGLFHDNMSVHPVGMRDLCDDHWQSLTTQLWQQCYVQLIYESYESYAIAICRVRVRGTMGHRPCQAFLWSRWSKEIKEQIAAKQKKREQRNKEAKKQNKVKQQIDANTYTLYAEYIDHIEHHCWNAGCFALLEKPWTAFKLCTFDISSTK